MNNWASCAACIGEFNPSLVLKETAHCKAIILHLQHNTTLNHNTINKMEIQQGTSKTPSLTPHYMDALLAGQQIHKLTRIQE
jgi:hypothetical protein